MKDATDKVVAMSEIIADVTDSFALMPLNVTLQAAVGENQMMSLVMSVHPGMEDDVAVNARIDRMVALLDRQKQRALIPMLEQQLAERLEIKKKVLIQAERIERQFEAEDAERVNAAQVLERDHAVAYSEQQSAWEENDGRRPFDPRNARVAKVLGPKVAALAKAEGEIEAKRAEIAQHRADHLNNIAECDARITELEERLAALRTLP